MVEELLEKIPPETCWAITAKTLWRFLVFQGDKLIAPLLGTAKDIISPLWSKEKWNEINEKITGDAGKKDANGQRNVQHISRGCSRCV